MLAAWTHVKGDEMSDFSRNDTTMAGGEGSGDGQVVHKSDTGTDERAYVPVCTQTMTGVSNCAQKDTTSGSIIINSVLNTRYSRNHRATRLLNKTAYKSVSWTPPAWDSSGGHCRKGRIPDILIRRRDFSKCVSPIDLKTAERTLCTPRTRSA